MNVLVSGASGIVGYGVLKSLKKACYNKIASSIYKESAANEFGNTFELAIKTSSADYEKWLRSILIKHKIQVAFPGIDDDMYWWDKNKSIFEELGVKCVLNNSRLIDLCKDKWLFYNELMGNDCESLLIPTSLSSEDLFESYGFPLLVKPRRGFGSIGVKKISSEKVLLNLAEGKTDEYIYQKYIGNVDSEYTIAAFGNGKGSFFNMFSMKRKLSKEGYTIEASVVPNDLFKSAIEKLCSVLNPVGPTNFQFRLENGNPKLLEINPRLSSSSSIRSAFGYNESEMSIAYYLHEELPAIKEYKKGKAIRYVEDLIFEE